MPLSIGIPALVGLFAIFVTANLWRKGREREDRAIDAANTPTLDITGVEYINAFSPDGHGRSLRVTFHNSGKLPATIREGQVTLTSAQYPNGAHTEKLKGVKVFAGTPKVVEFHVKHGVMHPGGVGEPQVVLHCEAIYERPGKADGETKESYELDQSTRTFRRI